MARTKTPSAKAKTATPPALGLGLDEPQETTAALAAGPLRPPAPAPQPPVAAPLSVSVEVAIPQMASLTAEKPVETPAVFSLALSDSGWAVSGQIPGCGPTLISGTEVPEVQHGPWVQGCIKAMREVTFANFQGPVEIRVPDPAAVGFLVVTLPTTERCYRSMKELSEPSSQKCQFPRPFREFLMLYLRLRPKIRWA